MPLVLVSKSDRKVSQDDEKMAAEYKDHFVYLNEPNCFARERFNPEAKDIPQESRGRATISGHGNSETFGDLHLTPRQLYEKLVERKFPFKDIKQIDLVGCGIGQNKQDSNYGIEFAKCIYEDPNNRHIKVNYVSSSALSEYFEKNILTEMIIRISAKDVIISSAIPGRKDDIKLLEYKRGIREMLDLHPGFSTDYPTLKKMESFDANRLGIFRRINNRIAELRLAEPPPDKKEDILAELMKMREEVEDTSSNLDNLSKRLNAFWAPPQSRLQQNQADYEVRHKLGAEQNLADVMSGDQLYQKYGTSMKALKEGRAWKVLDEIVREEQSTMFDFYDHPAETADNADNENAAQHVDQNEPDDWYSHVNDDDESISGPDPAPPAAAPHTPSVRDTTAIRITLQITKGTENKNQNKNENEDNATEQPKNRS